MSKITVNLEALAHAINLLIPVAMVLCGVLGYTVSFYFHFLTVTFLFLTVLNLSYLYGQRHHTLLANFGLLAQGRYMMESALSIM